MYKLKGLSTYFKYPDFINNTMIYYGFLLNGGGVMEWKWKQPLRTGLTYLRDLRMKAGCIKNGSGEEPRTQPDDVTAVE